MHPQAFEAALPFCFAPVAIADMSPHEGQEIRGAHSLWPHDIISIAPVGLNRRQETVRCDQRHHAAMIAAMQNMECVKRGQSAANHHNPLVTGQILRPVATPGHPDKARRIRNHT